MTEEEIKKFAKEYVQNNTDESVNSFIGEQLQKAFIEDADFMYYSNNEELKKELTEKDKQIAELKELVEKYRQAVDKCLHITFMGGGCEVNTIGQYATLVDGYLTDVEGLAKWKN